MENIKVQGLVRGSGCIFFVWGALSGLKGLFDAFFGEPEANLYSPKKWDFITYHQWLTWSGFELAYGAACIAIALVLFKYARFVPIYMVRKIAAGSKD